MNLGETIYHLRVKNNLSQDNLADALDVSRQSISKWENNMSVPELSKLIRMSEFFGISLDELVKGEAPLPEAAEPGKSEKQGIPPAISTTGMPAQGEPSGLPWTAAHILGILFLCMGALLCVLPFVLGALGVAGLLFAVPFLLCGAICLKAKRHIALGCAWAWYFSAYVFLIFNTGITWRIIRQTAHYLPEWNYTRLAIGWAELILFVVLLIPTMRVIGRTGYRFAGKKRLWLLGFWAAYVLCQVFVMLLNRLEINAYQNASMSGYIYPLRAAAAFLTGSQAASLVGALGLAFAAWKNRRKA